MNAFLKLSPEDRRLYCIQAASVMDNPLPAAVVEKDFWVCWILKLLSEIPDLKDNLTFKGGTSLSKAWGIIDRFSEDIDIAINRKVFGQDPPNGAEDATSNTQRKLRLETLEKNCATYIIYSLIPLLQEKIESYLDTHDFQLLAIRKGNEVNIEFRYPGTLKNELGGLLPVVLIEIVPRADVIPKNEMRITPIIYDVFKGLLDNGSFTIATLVPERTFLEKLLFIHETLGGYNKGSERKSRHYYDLFKLYEAGVFDLIKLNKDLFQMVVHHRQTFFRYNTLDYSAIFRQGIQFLPQKESWPNWRSDYSRTEVMIYNQIPSFDELMLFAKNFELEFNNWVTTNFNQ
jgi:predicted nucleotidyltransferase component of viral defense system